MQIRREERVVTIPVVAFECVFTCNLHAMLQNAYILRVPRHLGSPRFPPGSPHLLDHFLCAGAVKCDTDPQKDVLFEQKKQVCR